MLNSTPWTSTEKQNYQLFFLNNYICFSFNFFLIFYIISTILKKWKVQMLKCSNLWNPTRKEVRSRGNFWVTGWSTNIGFLSTQIPSWTELNWRYCITISTKQSPDMHHSQDQKIQQTDLDRANPVPVKHSHCRPTLNSQTNANQHCIKTPSVSKKPLTMQPNSPSGKWSMMGSHQLCFAMSSSSHVKKQLPT